MRALFVTVIVYILNCSYVLANSNIPKPVAYFVNQEHLIKELQNKLNLYGKANIHGVQGIGKTELVKKYYSLYNKNYKIAWYINASTSLLPQLLNLVEQINLGLKDNAKISLNPNNITDNLVRYFNENEQWLLVFDNLFIHTVELDKFLNMLSPSHGKVISIYRESKQLKEEIKVNNLSLEDVKNLISEIMKELDPKIVNELSEILVTNGAPTTLIVDSAYFLKNNPHYTVKEYIEKISMKNELILDYLKLVLKTLSNNAQEVLYKISFLNNQQISKNIIMHLVNNGSDVNDILTELLNTNLLRIISGNNDYPIFALHDIYKDELLKIIPNKQATSNQIINSLNNIFPKEFKHGTSVHYIFLQDKTLGSNIETIVKNMQKYNISVNFDMLELRLNLLIEDLELCLLTSAQNQIKWFEDTFLQNKILPKTNKEKTIFSSFLIYMSGAKFFDNMDSNKALELLNLAYDVIKDEEKNNEDLISYISIDLAQIQAYVGDTEHAKKTLSRVNTSKSDYLIKVLFVKSLINLMQGDYNNALIELEKEIELCNKLDYQEEWPAVVGQKAKIFCRTGRFQEAYEKLHNLYSNNYSMLEHNITDRADILTQLSTASLGLGKVNEALEYSKQAVEILIADNKRQNSPLNRSHDIFLAEAIVSHANNLAILGDYSKALEEYNKAEMIYKNVYKNNFIKIDNVSYLAFNGAKVSYKLGDEFLHKHYCTILDQALPLDHPLQIELKKYKLVTNNKSKL